MSVFFLTAIIMAYYI